MTEQDFYTLAEAELTKLADDVEKMDKNSALDIEYSDGILNIVVESTNQTYVINKHSASQKIWYSSPISGADYFSFDANSSKWLDANNSDLATKLFTELTQLIQING
jgi:iron donor protein CyaY